MTDRKWGEQDTMGRRMWNHQATALHAAMSKPEYSRPAGIAWAVWLPMSMYAYFSGSGLWLAASVVLFAVFEGIGVARAGPDTWSELVWAFLAGGRARIPLVLGWTGWIGLWLASYIPGQAGLRPFAGLSLISGLVLWLLLHFLLRGRYG